MVTDIPWNEVHNDPTYYNSSWISKVFTLFPWLKLNSPCEGLFWRLNMHQSMMVLLYVSANYTPMTKKHGSILKINSFPIFATKVFNYPSKSIDSLLLSNHKPFWWPSLISQYSLLHLHNLLLNSSGLFMSQFISCLQTNRAKILTLGFISSDTVSNVHFPLVCFLFTLAKGFFLPVMYLTQAHGDLTMG